MPDYTMDSDAVIALHAFLSSAPAWMYQARCVEEGLDPGSDDSEILGACARCPASDQCLSWARSMDIRTGIYGGRDMSQEYNQEG